MKAIASLRIFCSCCSHTLLSGYILIFFLDMTGTFFCGSFMFFCIVFALPLWASVFMCLVVTCWTSWLSYVVSNCEFVTFPLVS